MDIDIIASEVSDNFFYLVADSDKAVLIDPIDGAKAIEAVLDQHLEVVSVINTHFHPDHIGGNDEVLTRFPNAQLAVAEGDRKQIATQQPQFRDQIQGLQKGDVLDVGRAELQVLNTPGHTPGHISLRLENHLFSGDTIFVGGAGNCSFGGDAGTLFQTFRNVLRKLDPETRFYPGHDYAVRNIEFILSIEPENERARQMLSAAREHTDGAKPFLTTLGKEKGYNPFMRFDDPQLQQTLEQKHPDRYQNHRQSSHSRAEATFRTLRSLRNEW